MLARNMRAIIWQATDQNFIKFLSTRTTQKHEEN